MTSGAKLWIKATTPMRFPCFSGPSSSIRNLSLPTTPSPLHIQILERMVWRPRMHRKAYELRGPLSEHEKLSAEAAYNYFVTGDLEKQRQALELLARIYPRDPGPPFALGNLYVTLGQYEKALEGAREALRLDPSSPLNYAFLADTYLNLNRLGDARNTIQEGQKDGFASVHSRGTVCARFPGERCRRYVTASGLGSRQAGHRGCAPWPGSRHLCVLRPAGGRTRIFAARRRLRRTGRAERDRSEPRSRYRLDRSPHGHKVEAQEQANLALRHSTGREVQYGAALALALTKDSTKSSVARRRSGETFSSRYAGAIQLSAHTSRPACPQPEECHASHRYVAGCRSLRFGARPHNGHPLAEPLSRLSPRASVPGRASRGRSGCRIQEDTGSTRRRIQRAHRSSRASRPRPRLCGRQRHRQIPRSLPGFLCSLEKRGLRHLSPC